jgi:hypothetical protein
MVTGAGNGRLDPNRAEAYPVLGVSANFAEKCGLKNAAACSMFGA